MSDNLWVKERSNGWNNPNIRAFCGEKPKRCDLSRVQLQGVFKTTALVSSAIVEQLNALAGLDLPAFMPRGAEAGTAGTINIEKQIAILAKVVLLVTGRDITSVAGKARVKKLRAAFQDVVDMVTSHGELTPKRSKANPQGENSPIYPQRHRGLVDSG